MAEVPDDLKYTAEHEWARISGSTVRIGITDFAQESLGDVVYVSLPDLGTIITKGEPFGEVESTKSVSELFGPVDGTVTARNDTLDGQPEVINSDPYGAGWIIEVEVADTAQFDALLDAGTYGTLSG
jgi:glycine cleavage system H protein